MLHLRNSQRSVFEILVLNSQKMLFIDSYDLIDTLAKSLHIYSMDLCSATIIRLLFSTLGTWASAHVLILVTCSSR
jgi:hypothetical protein